jgi:hypothetical protein
MRAVGLRFGGCIEPFISARIIETTNFTEDFEKAGNKE